jgi:hypothetical protein
MALKFHHILARRTRWRIKSQDQSLVEKFARRGVAKLPQTGHARLRKSARDRASRFLRPGATDPND